MSWLGGSDDPIRTRVRGVLQCGVPGSAREVDQIIRSEVDHFARSLTVFPFDFGQILFGFSAHDKLTLRLGTGSDSMRSSQPQAVYVRAPGSAGPLDTFRLQKSTQRLGAPFRAPSNSCSLS